MKRLFSALVGAGIVAMSLGTAPALAAGSAAIARPALDQQAAPSPLAQTVDHRRYHRGHRDRHWGYRHHRPRYNRGPSFSLQFGSPGYYYAPRYRAAPRAHYRASNAHVRWCSNRYRSYRAWDNSFQPYNGPRQRCYSPYS